MPKMLQNHVPLKVLKYLGHSKLHWKLHQIFYISGLPSNLPSFLPSFFPCFLPSSIELILIPDRCGISLGSIYWLIWDRYGIDRSTSKNTSEHTQQTDKRLSFEHPSFMPDCEAAHLQVRRCSRKGSFNCALLLNSGTCTSATLCVFKNEKCDYIELAQTQRGHYSNFRSPIYLPAPVG